MNLQTWAEQQKIVLVSLGVNPVDAEIVVRWLVDNLPPLQNPDTWIVPARLFAQLRVGDDTLLREIVSAWMADETVEERHRRLLTATPIPSEEAGDSDDGLLVGLLAAYWFLTDKGQYYSRKPFRVVGERRLRRQYERYLEGVEDRFVELARAMHEGAIAPSTYQSTMRMWLRREHITFRALGQGGVNMLSHQDYQAIERILAEEAQRLAAMVQGVADGEISLLQAMDRARWYAGTASEQYWRGLEHSMGADPGHVLLSRNILRPAEHCETCLDLTDLGWQPVGKIPPPKVDRDCGRGCKCYLIYQQVRADDSVNWIGTRRR